MTTPDPAETRRRQLQRWIDAHFDGLQVEFIKSTNDGKTQINQGELSGLLAKKSFGEKRARRLEEQAGMPAGYLDGRSHQGVSVPMVSEDTPPYTLTAEPPLPQRWPFRRVSQRRLLDLKKHLGPQRGMQAMADIDEMLETAVLKWEMRASSTDDKSVAA